jgi:hypothetical protein
MIKTNNNLDIKFGARFGNNLHQIHSQPKGWKAK